VNSITETSTLPEIKAIAVDVDGTLTEPTRRISLDAISALRQAEDDAGVRVMIASGNVLPIARALSLFIGTSGPIIAENGGIVQYDNKTQYLTDKELPMQAFEMLQEQLGVKGIPTNHWRDTEIALDPHTTDIDRVKAVLKEAGYDLHVGTTGFAVHINNPGINKFTGLEVACELIEITPRNVMAIGDYENDIEMISNCGLGVAVANALPQVKEAAKFVATKPNGQGIVEVVEKFIL
jgi:phosphoglycolate phosphatase (TIGR01487 family)